MAITDDPSIPGFIAYKLSGNKLKSEREAEKAEKTAKEQSKPSGMIDVGVDAINKHKKQLQDIDNLKRGGKVKTKKYARGGGIEVRGKTRGRFV